MSTAPATGAEPESRTSLIDRTLSRLRVIASSARLPFVGGENPDLPEDEAGKLREQMQACLEARGGEVLARAQAANIAQIYLGLSAEGRRRFFDTMARDFGTNPDRVAERIAAYERAEDDGERLRAQAALRRVLRPPRMELLMQFNALPNGIKFLVDMRADLLRFTKDDPFLAALDEDFYRLMASWFDVGFLKLERITWDSPAALLEKLIAYEAVHEIRSWDDLRHRLHGNRRIYAYFHPSMPGEPLIFVQVALVAGIATSVQKLLDPDEPDPDPREADAAIFYSISNAQAGLRGISFGNFLIKRVVDQLARDLPKLKTFATLSPLPGFAVWLKRTLADGADDLREDKESQPLAALAEARGVEPRLGAVLGIVDWHADEEIVELVRPLLARHAARYLVHRRPDRRPVDPVARFHLCNGARIERINTNADVSAGGLARAYGMMVNYLYDPAEIERNHEAFAQDRVIAISAEIGDLVRNSPQAKDHPLRIRPRSTFGRMIGRG